jgi:hypothetical protein
VDCTAESVVELVKKAEYIRNNLQNYFGELFKLKMEGQDRSDYAQLEIPISMLKDNNARWVEIRLSNFVPLVAISSEDKVLDSCLIKIKLQLEKIGCIVVDQTVFMNGSSEVTNDRTGSTVLNELWYSLFDFE